MPASVTANMMTVVHASSNGTSIWFPDVCKTPTPGGPIPIPYPNVAMSSNTASGSTTVKVDKNPIMLKSSNYSMSTGDEAGSAMGVVSNKIKGKAEPVNYSFDVKVDGKNVFRLLDMMLQNCGSPTNGGPGSNLQAPLAPALARWQACQKTEAKKKEQSSQSTSWGQSGIVGPHQSVIQDVATHLRMVIYFRRTKTECAPWILKKHMPKPHSVLAGTTITADSVVDVDSWLEGYLFNEKYARGSGSYFGIVTGASAIGIVMSTQEGPDYGKPLRGFGRGLSGRSYANTWITGDYDLFQVVKADKRCTVVCQDGDDFARLQKEINKRLDWDAIQHGPQAQWCPTKKEIGGLKPFKMPDLVKRNLQGDPKAPAEVEFSPGRKPMRVIDTPLTMVAPKGAVVKLEKEEDVKDAMICEGCAE
jgi:hypothetical protein